MDNQLVFWACPYCIVPMKYMTSFADNRVHRYQCKFCKNKFDIQKVYEPTKSTESKDK